jgi:hypothetical protein
MLSSIKVLPDFYHIMDDDLKIVRLLEVRLKKKLEDLGLLGCDIVLLSHWFLVFEHNIVSSSYCLTHEDEVTKFHQIMSNHSPSDRASHPKNLIPQLHCFGNSESRKTL